MRAIITDVGGGCGCVKRQERKVNVLSRVGLANSSKVFRSESCLVWACVRILVRGAFGGQEFWRFCRLYYGVVESQKALFTALE